jgi:hypothetical protein
MPQIEQFGFVVCQFTGVTTTLEISGGLYVKVVSGVAGRIVVKTEPRSCASETGT